MQFYQKRSVMGTMYGSTTEKLYFPAKVEGAYNEADRNVSRICVSETLKSKI